MSSAGATHESRAATPLEPVHARDTQPGPGGASDVSTSEPVTRVVVLDQVLPSPHPTHRVEARRITITPGHSAGLHVHNGPVFGNIETGSVVYQIEGEPERVLAPGDVFYEPEGVRIARFDARDEGVTFLGYFLLAAGQTAQIEFPET